MAKKKPRGRPAQQIDASPEEIAEAVLSVPFKEIKPLLDESEKKPS